MSQAILSVIDIHNDVIVEHHLVPSEKSDEVLLDACARYCSNWDEHTTEDRTIIQERGNYRAGQHVMCVIHLDSDGRYEQ